MSGKASRTGRRFTAVGGRMALALAIAFPPGSVSAQGLPTGGSVASGSATISNPSSSSTLINQSSQKALINWQSFGVGAGNSVNFQQPNSAAITLNRVQGTTPSAINGSLTANGNVWIINGNGVLFGQGAQVNVGGLIATTSDIQDSDFEAGNYKFGT